MQCSSTANRMETTISYLPNTIQVPPFTQLTLDIHESHINLRFTQTTILLCIMYQIDRVEQCCTLIFQFNVQVFLFRKAKKKKKWMFTLEYNSLRLGHNLKNRTGSLWILSTTDHWCDNVEQFRYALRKQSICANTMRCDRCTRSAVNDHLWMRQRLFCSASFCRFAIFPHLSISSTLL